MCRGLPEILNHNVKSTPLLGAYMYNKLQTWWSIYCFHGWLNSLSHTLLHSHCNNTTIISTVFYEGFGCARLVQADEFGVCVFHC